MVIAVRIWPMAGRSSGPFEGVIAVGVVYAAMSTGVSRFIRRTRRRTWGYVGRP
jgi:hypothetical protein